ncbi:MAG: glycine cleavage system protein H [Bryobacterales bacterium]|nr:glycine cleavage system protein H [Bryobacterales bacterium]
MTVILVLLTFVAFAVLDYFLSRKAVAQPVAVAKKAPGILQPAYVEGFLVPEELRYHPGHTWLLQERRHLMRVGVDEFGAALAGAVEKIELPKPGQWIRQGQKAWSVFRNGEKAEMVSPIEGEVVEINPEVLSDPSLLRRDPYGHGWLMTVHVPDEESTARNLIPKSLVSSWMSDAIQRLYAWQPQLAGAAAADGGTPVEDLCAGLPGAKWREVTAEFFLTGV